MDPFNSVPDVILDLVFLQLNEEDLHETLRVSKTWFWASIRRIRTLKISLEDNPLKSIAKIYNENCGSAGDDKIDWRDLFNHLILDELVVNHDNETRDYLFSKGCNTAKLIIKTSIKATSVTLSSLKMVKRLQSFEYCTFGSFRWHKFIAECFTSSNSGFDVSIVCPIVAIKLNSSGWNTEAPVLHSVTKLGVQNVTIDFLRAVGDLCPNLEELHCSNGVITQDWLHVFPANVKRIVLQDMKLHKGVTQTVNVLTNSWRQLLPYLSKNWESVELFHIEKHDESLGYTSRICRTVYQAFPQQREEVFVCGSWNENINLASPHFQSREILVNCDGRKASELIIPPAKSVKLQLYVEPDINFSPRAVCLEPYKVERLALLLVNWDPFTHEPSGPRSFEGFCRLTDLTLSHVNALTIRMALDQCPSIKKLKLTHLKAYTIGSMSRGSSYANVGELLLERCQESMRKLFQVFPCLSGFKQSVCWENIQIRKSTTNWLWRYLVQDEKHYGVVFESADEIQYVVSDGLQASLSQAQKLLSENLQIESVCYLKGFKLLPRVLKQKVIYINEFSFVTFVI